MSCASSLPPPESVSRATWLYTPAQPLVALRLEVCVLGLLLEDCLLVVCATPTRTTPGPTHLSKPQEPPKPLTGPGRLILQSP